MAPAKPAKVGILTTPAPPLDGEIDEIDDIDDGAANDDDEVLDKLLCIDTGFEEDALDEDGAYDVLKDEEKVNELEAAREDEIDLDDDLDEITEEDEWVVVAEDETAEDVEEIIKDELELLEELAGKTELVLEE